VTAFGADAKAPFARAEARLLENSRIRPGAQYAELRGAVDAAGRERAREEISGWPGYSVTPLYRLDGLAKALGVSSLWYKDEGGRFGLGSFKALGGAYGVLRVIQREVRRLTDSSPSSGQLLAREFSEIVSGLTVCCATDGNHGRSVAWGAGLFGCRSVVYLHPGVSEQRESAIAAFGARIVRVAGDYDESVRRARQEAEESGHLLVADTSFPGYERVPRDVMHGYTVMVAEVLEQLGNQESLPTHVFVQGGVGGLAAAVCAHLWESLGPSRPHFTVVEPHRADCLYQSALAGRPRTAAGELDTVMAGLACGEPSILAWRVLERGCNCFMTIPDDVVGPSMRLLRAGTGEDPCIVAGESAVAGLAALLVASFRRDLWRRLQLGADSRVLVFGTEGATDPELYRRMVGGD
jgi:diaminopropionate ammonia-lyase